MRRCTAEIAFPFQDNSPNFIKFEAKQNNLFKLVPGKINLVTEVNSGLLIGKTYQNDRFYLYNTLGYLHTGHTESSMTPRPEQKVGECATIVMGDDLGV